MIGSGIRKIQPEVEKFNLELNKKKAASFKQQAASIKLDISSGIV